MKNANFFALAIMATLSIIACKKDQVTSSGSNLNPQLVFRDACTVTPVLYENTPAGDFPGGNVLCSQVGDYAFSTGRIDDETRCGGTSGPITWTTDPSCTYVSWSWTGTSTIPCGMSVILHGGGASYVYNYPNGCTSGSGLASPLNNGGNVPQLSNITFCWNECNVLSCRTETAFGGNTKGGGSAWWYAFDTQGAACQNIYAGQKLMAGGSVCYNAGTGMLDITLGPGWSLQNVPESVKVQGYNTLPAKRQPAGLFTTYKGTSLSVPGDGSRYYVVQLDVAYCE